MPVGRVTFSTNFMMVRQQVNKAQQRFTDASVPATTGKRINTLSDQPEVTYRLFDVKTRVAAIEVFNKNITNARELLSNTDAKLDEGVELINRVRELAISGNVSTISDADIDNHLAELDNLSEELMNVGNYRIHGRYIFSGAKTDTKPFTLDPAAPSAPTDPADPNYAADLATFLNSHPVLFNGNNTTISFAVTADMDVDVNIDGEQVFMGDGGGQDIFQVIKNLKWAIEHRDSNQIGIELENVDKVLGQFLNARGEIGAQTMRLDSSEDVLNGEDLRLTQELSDLESADIADVATELSIQETALRVIFSTASRIMDSALSSILAGR